MPYPLGGSAKSTAGVVVMQPVRKLTVVAYTWGWGALHTGPVGGFTHHPRTTNGATTVPARTPAGVGPTIGQLWPRGDW